MNAIDEVMKVLASGSEMSYFGEPVSTLDHALQCAQLARDAGADEETVLAALLHDIGHMIESSASIRDEAGTINHDEVGADYLRRLGFSGRVAELVEGHVDAKRFLTATSSAYAARLSATSTLTLELQGGPMSPEEVERFKADPLLHEKLRLRTWDEQAKEPGREIAPLCEYRRLLEAHLGR
jgi:2-amino-1-hydroxyethylphosphonate dioxygenase (glycine-forming)